MSVLTEQEVRARARQATRDDQLLRKSYFARNSREILHESVIAFSESRTYDMFLSHSIRDAEIILGVKSILEDLGYTPYVDWIEDPQLERNDVTSETADILRKRMRSSKSLLYVTTNNSDSSQWMPWECGYFDGFREKVAIAPIKGYSTDYFQGVEYLGLYPYIVKDKNRVGQDKLWINKNTVTYIAFDEWVKTKNSELIWNSQS
ncbi:hypothetical protein [Methylobacter sp.]|uniref:hypothetical protein n=1 Tax=Methylobacter sp. TaxID=2051955 RepID=UPI003DA36C30